MLTPSAAVTLMTHRMFLLATVAVAAIGAALFLGAVWRAETVFDSKAGAGDVGAYLFWNAVAKYAILSAGTASLLAVVALLRARIARPGAGE